MQQKRLGSIILFLATIYMSLIWLSPLLVRNQKFNKNSSTELALGLNKVRKCHNQTEFIFHPTPENKPFKDNVVIMLLTSPSTVAAHEDFYFLNALAIIHSLKYNPVTKLNGEIEFACIITETVSEDKKKSLLEFGVRLIQTSSIKVSWDGDAERWANWAPDQWFSNMRAYKENNPNKYFFGAVKDWGLENDEYFNAGSFIFEPNCEHYENLMRLVSRKSEYDYGFMEQGLLNWYFKKDRDGKAIGSSNGLIWQTYDPMLNVQWVDARSKDELSAAYAFHAKIWGESVPSHVYDLWRKHLMYVKKFQENLKRDSDVVFLPDTFVAFKKMVEDKTFGKSK